MRANRSTRIAALLLATAACGKSQVTEGNRAPTLDVPASIAGTEGVLLAFIAVAEDPDDDVLSVSAAPLPPGASFEASTGSFTWTPSFDAARLEPYRIVFSADDGRVATQKAAVITLEDVNRRPALFLPPSPQTITEGGLLSFEVTASDEDSEDTVTVTASHAPDGATFDGRMFSWRPGFDQARTHVVTFTAWDGHRLSAPASQTGDVSVDVVDCDPETSGEFCVRLQKDCDPVTDEDNCGTPRTVNCGTCIGPETCGGGGVEHVCGCTPETGDALCLRLGKDCDMVTEQDNCGVTRMVDCGSCTVPETCGGGGVPNVCGCTAESDTELCARLEKDCNSIVASDNCAAVRTVNCGSCEAPQTCGGEGTPNVCGTIFDWPRWSMPDSPTVFCTNGASQISCPASGDVGYGQDGNDSTHPPAYAAGADTVTDLVTGLVWQRTLPAAKNWRGAKQYCAGLDLDGRTDWRLPTRIELASVVDLGRFDPALDAGAFPGTPSAPFWSSSPMAGQPGFAWAVHFAWGNTGSATTATGNFLSVRCARGVSNPQGSPGRDYDIGASTVLDKKTGLRWQRAAASGYHAWLDALANCDDLVLDGNSDWRLPNYKELQTIVNEKVKSPAIDRTAFPGTPPEGFWSSSPSVAVPFRAWLVDFSSGYYGEYSTDAGYRVRCVR